jgi:acyl carrier protein
MEDSQEKVTNFRSRLLNLMSEMLGVEQSSITPETDIIEDLGADELDIVELVMAIEEEWDMEIPDQDVADEGFDKGGIWATGVSSGVENLIENLKMRNVDQWLSYILERNSS